MYLERTLQRQNLNQSPVDNYFKTKALKFSANCGVSTIVADTRSQTSSYLFKDRTMEKMPVLKILNSLTCKFTALLTGFSRLLYSSDQLAEILMYFMYLDLQGALGLLSL